MAATPRVQPEMNVAVFSCCRRVWCVAGLLLASRLFLLSAEVDSSAVNVRPSGLQDNSCMLVMVPASSSSFFKHVDIESVVARVLSHNHNLLLPVKEVEVIPLGTLPQGCSDEGLPFLECDTACRHAVFL